MWDEDKKEMSPILPIFAFAGYATGLYPNIGKVVVRQFTGLRDNTGEMIFEGDIVQRYCFDEECKSDHLGEVFYSDHWTMFQIKEKDMQPERVKGDYHPPLAFGDLYSGILAPLKVLGNIYQNPELLK